ncbi:hypothetical protein HAX54_022121 [Datura stramonium]|uniref:Uncharacterized protein n=1 Tax=Datura stramonium TaxID=4076 RepID=A0ABS8S6E4_DATST|nr:hypothetical protein [Datura stramonium]
MMAALGASSEESDNDNVNEISLMAVGDSDSEDDDNTESNDITLIILVELSCIEKISDDEHGSLANPDPKESHPILKIEKAL